MKAWLKKFDIFLQEMRVAKLHETQAAEALDIEFMQYQFAQTSMELVCASLRLSQLRGDLPSAVRNVIPTSSRSVRFFDRQRGFSESRQLWAIAGACACLAVLWSL